jgi:hypothetical protein
VAIGRQTRYRRALPAGFIGSACPEHPYRRVGIGGAGVQVSGWTGTETRSSDARVGAVLRRPRAGDGHRSVALIGALADALDRRVEDGRRRPPLRLPNTDLCPLSPGLAVDQCGLLAGHRLRSWPTISLRSRMRPMPYPV